MRPEGDKGRAPCPACGGTGQMSYFKGVSRFLLSVEECPECAGLGVVLPTDEAQSEGSGGDERRD